LSDGSGPASGQIFAQGETFPITFAGVSGLTFQIFAIESGDLLTGTDLSQIPDLDELDLGRSFFRLVDGNGTSKNLTATFTSATFTDLSAEPETTPVPVPAALPLLLGGISLFGALKLRRSGGARGRAAT
jgi:hypothetical protein